MTDMSVARCDFCDQVLSRRIFILSRFEHPNDHRASSAALCSRKCVTAQLDRWEPDDA